VVTKTAATIERSAQQWSDGGWSSLQHCDLAHRCYKGCAVWLAMRSIEETSLTTGDFRGPFEVVGECALHNFTQCKLSLFVKSNFGLDLGYVARVCRVSCLRHSNLYLFLC